MAERHAKAEGLDLEFLKAQSSGLLPDRLEMHRRRRHHWHRRRGRRVTNTFILVIEDEGSQFNNGIYTWPQP